MTVTAVMMTTMILALILVITIAILISVMIKSIMIRSSDEKCYSGRHCYSCQ